MDFSDITFNQLISFVVIAVLAILGVTLTLYFGIKAIMLGFYEAKLFFKKKLKESNDEKG